MTLILASKSPRRAELLQKAGLAFVTLALDINESPLPGENPEATAKRLALAKANAALRLADNPDVTILAADTLVVVDHTALGKPQDTEDARQMLRRLSGRSHEVITGTCLLFGNGALISHEVHKTEVTFRVIDPSEIEEDIASGEPMDKAGAYAIQGRAGRYVTSVHGLVSNVVGLPIEALLPYLQAD